MSLSMWDDMGVPPFDDPGEIPMLPAKVRTDGQSESVSVVSTDGSLSEIEKIAEAVATTENDSADEEILVDSSGEEVTEDEIIDDDDEEEIIDDGDDEIVDDDEEVIEDEIIDEDSDEVVEVDEDGNEIIRENEDLIDNGEEEIDLRGDDDDYEDVSVDTGELMDDDSSQGMYGQRSVDGDPAYQSSGDVAMDDSGDFDVHQDRGYQDSEDGDGVISRDGSEDMGAFGSEFVDGPDAERARREQAEALAAFEQELSTELSHYSGSLGKQGSVRLIDQRKADPPAALYAPATSDDLFPTTNYPPDGDLESQTTPEQARPRRTKDFDDDDTKKGPPIRNFDVWFCFCLFVLVVCCVIGLWLGLIRENAIDRRDDRSTSGAAPTPAPTMNILSGSKTPLAEVVGSGCDLSGLEQPNVIDQCSCNGEISVIASDVLERYDFLRSSFIPTLYSDFAENQAACTARNQALIWLSTATNVGKEDIQRLQRYVLALFYFELNGAGWAEQTNWLSILNECTWAGIECNNENVVIGINLDAVTAQGTIVTELGLLLGLTTLSLSENEITGAIPSEIFLIPFLTSIDFSSNKLTGPLPAMLAEAELIQNFNVEDNLLTGRLPVGLGNGNSLVSLNLGRNSFTGPIPNPVYRSPNLEDLQVHSNQLSGPIPEFIAAATSLTNLRLGPNAFTGTLQRSIGSLTNLETLYIIDVDIDGRIPGSYGLQLTNLVELHITGTNVGGSIPTFIGSLTKLTNLNLSNNGLRNEIPPSLGSLTRLTTLNMMSNEMSGPIPSQLGNIQALEELYLNNNGFIGTVPPELMDLENLRILRLDGNEIDGRVPDGICQLDLMEFVVDCPVRVNGETTGVICGIPTCCTSCAGSS